MIELKAINRSLTGKKVKQLRQQGLVPANIVIKSQDSIPISINQSELTKTLEKAGYTQPVKIQLEEDQFLTVLTTEVSRNPINDSYIHVVFQKIKRGDSVVISVPVELEGQLTGEASNLTLLQILDTIEIEIDPLSAPEKIVVDISDLKEDGDVVRIQDIKLPEGSSLVGDDRAVIARTEKSRLQISSENQDEVSEEDEESTEGDQDQSQSEQTEDEQQSSQGG